ncbi:PAS domain-containing sensor histidine kinase [candidate division TA06 bacterium]|uniref:histidine kinase n=1 Tax=candidate division TA06 bacterium TaxID=2250710 RepID=A0A933IBR0_UNCT6|nr:PAS domain-containing sensor histidine kinase [candidate division TA06 bacterium]
MLSWLWFLAIPFLAGIFLASQTLALKIAGGGGMLLLFGWGAWLYFNLSRQKSRTERVLDDLAQSKDEAGRQKSQSQELARQREKLEESRKELECQLQELKSAWDSLPAGMMLISKPEGKVLSINSEAERISGYRAIEIVGRNWEQALIAPQNPAQENSRIQAIKDKDLAELDQDKIILKDGTELEVYSRIWNLPGGRRTGWMFYPKNQAMDYNRLREEFITNISHELRTPLTVIKGYAEILYEDAKASGNEQADLMKVIVDEGDRLAGLLDSIINFRQASSGMLGLRQEKVDIIALLNAVIHDLEPKASKKSVKILKKLPVTLAPSRGDFNALRFAFSNILDNAVKFNTPGGGITVETGGWRLEDGMWKMQVHISDTGTGIAPEVLPHIFEKFYRTDQEVHTIQGTGIGLSLTKEILETHGGNIAVESTVGKGTKFTVSLPMSE